MNQGFLADLPSEIIINILSRLPVQNIITCKFVCKTWLNILNTPEFVKSHLPKAAPGLVVFQPEMQRQLFSIFEFEDALGPEHHELHYKPVTKFDLEDFISLPCSVGIEGSANGLLFLRQISDEPDSLYVCNPITREYIKFSIPEITKHYYPAVVTYGFGVSKMAGQHKVVRIFHDCIRNPNTHKLLSIPKFECQVYTLETGSCRSITPGAPLEYSCRSNGVLLNGNLHWLVMDLKGSFVISCLDLESEHFSTFSSPCPPQGTLRYLLGLVALDGCLCLCDNTSENEIVIWTMKEYGVEKSWTKEFVLTKGPDDAGECYEVVYPIKSFKDGDILMCWWDFRLFYYCNKTKTTQPTSMCELQSPGRLEAMLHSSTFLSIKSIVKENVSSF